MPAIAGMGLVGFSSGYKFWFFKDLDIEQSYNAGIGNKFFGNKRISVTG